jgi:PAS domain S-box-containing protein
MFRSSPKAVRRGKAYTVSSIKSGVNRKTPDGNINMVERMASEEDPRREGKVLRHRSEQLAVALSASETGTFRWNPHTGKFLEFDDNLKRLFGKEPAAQFKVTEDLTALVYPDDRDALILALEASQRGTDFSLEHRVVLPDGSTRWLNDQAKMEWENGKPSYLVGACTDVTRRKVAEEALIKSEKLAAMGRLAGVMAHEINNPLEAVINTVYLLRDNPSLDEQARSQLELIEGELLRIAHITKQSLGFYRESARPVPVSLAEVLEEVLAIYDPKLRSSRITVEKHYRTHESLLSMPGEMRQVFLNLIGNAIEAMPDGGCLRVDLYCCADSEHSGFRVCIVDTGAGIKAIDTKNIFEPFFTTKEQKGTGLGLWVTRGIIHKHGGAIRFRTSRLGSRIMTCFSVFLPGHPVPCSAAAMGSKEKAS